MNFCKRKMQFCKLILKRKTDMRKICALCLLFCMLLPLPACKMPKTESMEEKIPITDAFGTTVYIKKQAKAVSCFASFTQMWLLSGGTLCGVTEDAVKERGLKDCENAEIIGTVKHIDLEKVLSLHPDYVILSADLAAHLSLRESLIGAGVPCGYFKEDTFSDYKGIMEQFCKVNGRMDLYQQNVLAVEKEIEDIKAKMPKKDSTVLLLRAYSTGMKAKTDDILAGQILKELGLRNIAENEKSMLEDLSPEHILKIDPDYIFTVTMGNAAGAIEYLKEITQKNPLWSGLSAVKNKRFYILPKELFHYKPNNRWSESYAYIAKLLCPEIFGE